MIITVDTESIRVQPVAARADARLIEEVADTPVALLGDCLQRMGMLHHSIRPLTSHATMAGTVYPVLCREGDNLAIHRALDEVQPGDVLVINALGELNRSVFGGIIGEACLSLGVTGVVVDGSIRDVEELDRMGLPVYARGVTPSGPYKHGPGSIGEAVACGGIVAHAGDAIFGDRDGLIVIRPDELPLLPPRIAAQHETEKRMRARIASLAAATEARA
ncbi:MAG TPA: RraA family protein [Microbacteriaceae bacterium]|nr:RraA family protein [Microbacteriaceae bacterium]